MWLLVDEGLVDNRRVKYDALARIVLVPLLGQAFRRCDFLRAGIHTVCKSIALFGSELLYMRP